MSSWTPDFGFLDRTPPAWAPKRPVRIALLGDFSAGASAGRLQTGAELARRKPIAVEFDTLEDALARLDVKLTLPLGDQGTVELAFGDLDAFHPDQLYRELALFSQLSSLRKQLGNTATFAKAAVQVQGWADTSARKASSTSRRSRARGAALAADARLDDFARLVGLPSAPEQAQTPIDHLLKNIVAPFVVPAPNPQKDALVAAVDHALSDAMRAVLHHADFQALEALWRGADFLLRRLETGPGLQVHLIDLSAEELAADLSQGADLAETALYKLLVDTPSQDKTGGYTLLCGLYQFEATPPHTELLGRMAQIAHHAGAPFTTGLSLQGLTDRKQPPHPLVQQALKALQALPAAGHLSLMGPRFMLRHPYGKRSDPVSVFDFEEFTAGEGLRGMLWGHPALLAASAIAGEGGLVIGDLPFHHFRDADSDTVALPCTERLLNTDMATTLRDWGVSPVLAHKGAPEVRLAGLDAVNGQALGKASPPRPSKPRVGVDTRIGIGSQLSVTATTRVPPASPAAAPTQAATSEGGASEGAADDLDALLAGLEGGDSASPEAAGTSGDEELDALLASLGGSTDAPGDSTPTAETDPDMDPELAALLASLG